MNPILMLLLMLSLMLPGAQFSSQPLDSVAPTEAPVTAPEAPADEWTNDEWAVDWDDGMADSLNATLITYYINLHNALYPDSPITAGDLVASALPSKLSDFWSDDMPSGSELQALLDTIYFDSDGYAKVYE